MFKLYLKVMLVTSKFFNSPLATPTANRSHRGFSPHHRNHSTAFLPESLAPHHLCGRAREGPLSWVLSFKALPILVSSSSIPQVTRDVQRSRPAVQKAPCSKAMVWLSQVKEFPSRLS